MFRGMFGASERHVSVQGFPNKALDKPPERSLTLPAVNRAIIIAALIITCPPGPGILA